MINIRNIKGENAFLHVLLGETLCYFSSLAVFHNHDNISPGELFFGKRPGAVKACRLGLKPAFEKLFGCFASVLILVADKKHSHNLAYKHAFNLNFAVLEASSVVFALK